jgi:hypothetical protein
MIRSCLVEVARCVGVSSYRTRIVARKCIDLRNGAFRLLCRT